MYEGLALYQLARAHSLRLVCLVYCRHRMRVSLSVAELSFIEVFGFALVLVAIAGLDQLSSVKKVLCSIVSDFSEQLSLRRFW